MCDVTIAPFPRRAPPAKSFVSVLNKSLVQVTTHTYKPGMLLLMHMYMYMHVHVRAGGGRVGPRRGDGGGA